jgi:hypothetical protein
MYIQFKKEGLPMLRPPYAIKDIADRAQTLYNERIRSHVDKEENHGKYLVIDVGTGEYEIDADHLAASNRVASKRPDAVLYAMRIGYTSLGHIRTRFSLGASTKSVWQAHS